MKRIFNWQVVLGLSLIALTTAFYILHYLIFRDARHIFIYLLGDVAFVFFEVFLVTLVIHGVLSYREKRSMLDKLNMVIGSFFSEVGTELITLFLSFDARGHETARRLAIGSDWSAADCGKMRRELVPSAVAIDCARGDLEGLKNFLSAKRAFLLTLLGNPNLLEHESFTNLLWAVFHLTDELSHRKKLTGLAERDYEHLAGDIGRAYVLLLSEWLSFLCHLKNNYPYLFSLAARRNPFDPHASVEIR